jgi:hypothetical protein
MDENVGFDLRPLAFDLTVFECDLALRGFTTEAQSPKVKRSKTKPSRKTENAIKNVRARMCSPLHIRAPQGHSSCNV